MKRDETDVHHKVITKSEMSSAVAERHLPKPKALVVSTLNWPSAARAAIALAEAGFEIGAVSPLGSFLRQTQAAQSNFIYWNWLGNACIGKAITKYRPDLLVCTDDCAVSHLHEIYERFARSQSMDAQAIVELIERSLGSPAHFEVVRSKSMFIEAARTAGVLCPRSSVVSHDGSVGQLTGFDYPALVKADQSHGGKGVRLVHNRVEAAAAARELSAKSQYRNAFVNRLSWWASLWGIAPRSGRTVTLQQNISGSPANSAVACWKGKVLARISVRVLETLHEFGPSTVIRVIDHPEMSKTADLMVQRLNLSGFVGFDFVIDDADRAWLLEMNPRTTPTFHLPAGSDTTLPGALYERLLGREPVPSATSGEERTIALFPQELHRLRNSAYLSNYVNDVPWGEPDFVRFCISEVVKENRVAQILRRVTKNRKMAPLSPFLGREP